MDWFTSWFSTTNLLYAGGLVLAAILTIVSAKYRKVIKELGDVARVLEEAYADNRLTHAEKDKIIKEVLDVIKAFIGIFWRFKIKP